MQVHASIPSRSLLQSPEQLTPPQDDSVSIPAAAAPEPQAGGAQAGSMMAPAPVPALNIPAAVVTPVGSGEDLQKAAQAPARDIEIQAHLDLRGMDPSIDPLQASLDYDGDDPALIYAFRPLRSIRVCTHTLVHQCITRDITHATCGPVETSAVHRCGHTSLSGHSTSSVHAVSTLLQPAYALSEIKLLHSSCSSRDVSDTMSPHVCSSGHHRSCGI